MFRKCPATAPVGALIGAVAALAVCADRAEAQLFEYSIIPISPSTQSAPLLFEGPYYYHLLTNTSDTSPDSYFLEILNLAVNPTPDWFPQVCIGAVCFEETLTVTLGPGQSDTVGVNVVPFSNGVGTFDFQVTSVGNPSLTDTFTGLTLYAGTAAVGAPEIGAATEHVILGQNAPNPVREATSISFLLPSRSPVRLSVHDVAGRLVATLLEDERSAGPHRVTWSGADAAGRAVPGGVYFYRLATSEATFTKRLTVIR